MRVFNTLVVLGAVVLVATTMIPCFGQEDVEQKEEAPVVTNVRFDPADPETGSNLKVDFKLNESAVRAEVKWFVNEVEIGPGKYDGVSAHAELGQPIKEGDKIKAEITPFAGDGTEGAVATKSVTVRNAPPELEMAYQKLEGQTYKAKVEAKDPDGDEVTLDLQGPEGMKIDQKGNITWKLPSKTAGKFDVKVTARDGKGAEAVLTFTLGIRR